MNIKNSILKLPLVQSLKTEKIHSQLKAEEKQKKLNYKDNRFSPDDSKASPSVSIIIYSENVSGKLDNLLHSLRDCQSYDNYEVVIATKRADEASRAYIGKFDNEINIRLVETADNESISEIYNEAVEETEGDYLLFMDNNLKITDGWLDELLKTAFLSEHIGAVGARLIYPKIPENYEGKDTSWKVMHAGVSFKDKTVNKNYFIQPIDRTIRVSDEKNYKCAAVSGKLMLVSRKAFESVEGFDTKYLDSYWDIDFCLKLSKNGFDNYYCDDCLAYYCDSDIYYASQNDVPQNDVDVFRGKWQKLLSDAIFDDKINNHLFYTEDKLTVKIVTSKDVDEERVTKIKNTLLENGYIVKLQSREKDKEYNIGVATDVVLCLDPDYDISAIKKCKSDIVIIDSEIDDKVDRIKDYLRTLCDKELCDKEIDILGAMPDNDTTKFWGDYHYALALKKEFEKQGYKANILSREKWYNKSTAKYVIVLRGLRKFYPGYNDGRKYIMWNISHPADVSVDEYELYNYIFFASEHMQNMYKDKITVPSGVLQQCTDPDVMKSVENGEKTYELLFVGNSRHVFRRILKDLLPTNYKLTVYGRHWEEFPVQEYVVNDYIDNNVVGQAYHDAKILLNDHWDDMREYGIISNRIFDALSSGAFVISDDVPGLDELLDGSVVTYKSPEDLKEKIDYYMNHGEERNAKALAGQKIVLGKHTFANRVEEIINVINELK